MVENCQIGGQVGIAGHLTIGNHVKIQAQSGIGRNVKDNETASRFSSHLIMGIIINHMYILKTYRRLLKTINDLEKKVQWE